MTKYKIEMTTDAENDLKAIFRYVTEILLEPNIARKIYNSIYKKIFALEYMAKRHKVISEISYKPYGIRRIVVSNYSIIYTVNEESQIVMVLRVVYSRRELQGII